MEVEKATVAPLHYNWQYLDDCCKLINEEWPRSTTARMHSLEASCDSFPTSLILLLQKNENENLIKSVVGHSKISPIHRFPKACFIESVVVSKKFRGQGWGRYIMQETEKYIKSKGKFVIYLSTSDKEDFYSKLGYSKCEPISIYGGKGIQLKNVLSSSFFRPVSLTNAEKNGTLTFAPPPPPFPPKSNRSSSTKIYMQKTIF